MIIIGCRQCWFEKSPGEVFGRMFLLGRPKAGFTPSDLTVTSNSDKVQQFVLFGLGCEFKAYKKYPSNQWCLTGSENIGGSFITACSGISIIVELSFDAVSQAVIGFQVS